MAWPIDTLWDIGYIGCMSKTEAQIGIERMQQIQRQNPPSSEAWKRASVVIHKLATILNNGVAPKDACGKRS